ncbi:PREDICTED: WAP four-disulfide core domain protein 5 isoform X1 [Mandrillus leucophaeus]|uniref:WAP four-disulfide core domain protein 5 isoform X1 n=1 Tax=Mandrillus leucophaeus TaxID=9568 RepID=UPI0005F53E44|nr:PREDICTED: WAP four-disulfide core domain protein 5 isoform X1 [Mandrillus leucophaeus]
MKKLRLRERQDLPKIAAQVTDTGVNLGGSRNMRIQSLLLLGVLLAVGSQLPAVFGRKKGEKWGGCPADDGPCLLSVPDQCVEDSQCPLTRKCCYRACFRQCVPRVSVKPGSCPQDQLRCLSPMNHLCHKDSDCSGKKRCCHSACGRDCRDPTRG